MSEVELVAVGVPEVLALAPRVTVVVAEDVSDAVSVAVSVADDVDCELSIGLVLTTADTLKVALAVVMDDGNGALVWSDVKDVDAEDDVDISDEKVATLVTVAATLALTAAELVGVAVDIAARL